MSVYTIVQILPSLLILILDPVWLVALMLLLVIHMVILQRVDVSKNALKAFLPMIQQISVCLYVHLITSATMLPGSVLWLALLIRDFLLIISPICVRILALMVTLVVM